MWSWLRRHFIAGFFVTVPLVVSVVALVWLFQFADRMTSQMGTRLFGRSTPGLGILATMLVVLAVGAFTTNVIGRRLLSRAESLLMHVPVFRTVYGPVKQLVAAFSPDNELGFKRMALVEQAPRGFVLGFVTKEFTVDRGRGPEPLMAIYVPTNHLYLGDILVCAPDQVSFPDLTVQEGIRIFLTGGMGLPDKLTSSTGEM
jgi:uncharacterized membrane protein